MLFRRPFFLSPGSPSLPPSLPSVLLPLSLSSLLATIFLPEPLPPLHSFHLTLLTSASASFRERAVRWPGPGPEMVHGHRFWTPSRHIQERDTSGAPRLLLTRRTRTRSCVRHESRVFAHERPGYVPAVAAFVRRYRQKGRNTRPSERAPCTL